MRDSVYLKFPPPAGTSFNGRTPRSGRGYWGSNPYVPAKSHFARQTTTRPAFASVSNVVITAQLTAGTGQAVHNFKASKNFLLPTSVRIPDSSCRVLPFAQPTADNGPHAVHHTLQLSKARPGSLRCGPIGMLRIGVLAAVKALRRYDEWRGGLRIGPTGL